MKYWVYKDSRILGPFDKDAVAGLPGLDASTLVSAGDTAGAGEGEWRPAGDVAEFSGLASALGPSWAGDEFGSTYGLLDKLQIDAAGLIGDDEFPGAAEDLFQDADMKKTFGDLLTPRPPANETELRKAKEQVSELSLQLEMLYQRVTELEAGHTNLVHRLVEKELQLRGHPPQAAELDRDALAKDIIAAIAHPPPPPVAPQASAPPAAAPAPIPAPAEASAVDWSSVAPGGAFPSFAPVDGVPAFPAAPPAPPAPPAPEVPAPDAPVPPAPEPPERPSFAGAALELSLPEPAAPEPATPEPAPKKSTFERKQFKVAPTIKAFRVVGPEDAPAAGSVETPAAAPVPEAVVPPPPAAVPAPVELKIAAPPAVAAPPAAEAPPGAPSPAPFDWGAPAAAPVNLAPAPSKPQPLTAPSTDPAFALPAASVSPFEPSSAPATPMPAPPATLSFGAPPSFSPEPQPMPSFSGAGGGDAPPNTASQMSAPSTQEVMARLAKPAPETAPAPKRPPRNNKIFAVAGAVLVVVMGVIGFLSLRHPKDLKQMAALDDGRSGVGYAPVEETPAPPMVKPRQLPAAAPAPAPNETPQAAPESKLDAAVAMVKDFPLDGGRGTVASWLQYSYSASPGAGKESWSASETSDKTYLVEYRFTPSAPGGTEVHYLFEADMDRGFVIGKNLDGKRMLAGGPPASEEKPKAKAKAKAKKKPARAKAVKRAAKRRVEPETPKEVPLLPLPSEGELRPPAEDDGAFRSDTVNSGL